MSEARHIRQLVYRSFTALGARKPCEALVKLWSGLARPVRSYRCAILDGACTYISIPQSVGPGRPNPAS